MRLTPRRAFAVEQWRGVAKCRTCSLTFVGKMRMIRPVSRSNETQRRVKGILRKRNGTKVTISSSSRDNIYMAVLQSPVRCTTGSFESCFVLPSSPHAMLHSHHPIAAGIFSTMFSAAFVCLAALLVASVFNTVVFDVQQEFNTIS